MFLSQVLFKGEQRSCIAAVSRVAVLLVGLGQQPPSGNTGAYCRARAKLSEPVLRRLTSELADGCERDLPQRWLWHSKRQCHSILDRANGPFQGQRAL